MLWNYFVQTSCMLNMGEWQVLHRLVVISLILPRVVRNQESIATRLAPVIHKVVKESIAGRLAPVIHKVVKHQNNYELSKLGEAVSWKIQHVSQRGRIHVNFRCLMGQNRSEHRTYQCKVIIKKCVVLLCMQYWQTWCASSFLRTWPASEGE